jgi:hypothetical protein
MRASNAALLDAAQAAVLPTLFAMTLLQQLSLPVLAPMHTLPRWLAGACVVVWLCLTLALARVGSARKRWVLVLMGSAGAAALAAALALVRHGSVADALGWSMVAVVLAGLGVLVARWRTKPVRVAQRRTAPRAASATGWAIAIGYGVCAALFIDGFARSLAAPGATRGAGMLLMLVTFFLLLPAATLASWYPRIARIGWTTGATCALAVVILVDTPSLAGLLVTLAVAGYAVGAPIQADDGEAMAIEAED